MILSDRKKRTQNAVALAIYERMEEKKTNLVLSLDVTEEKKFFDILERAAPHIVMVKIHCDIISGFNSSFLSRLFGLKEKYGFLIFEDRKFADIGNTVSMQYTGGAFSIIEWADLVTTHIVQGPGAIAALRQAWKESRFSRAALILSHMSSEGNLFSEEHRERALQFANEYCDFVIGFIGSPGKDAALSLFRERAWSEFLIFVPGVNIEKKGDAFLQTYVSPEDAIEQGGDIIIVGRGIYNDKDPKRAAIEYKERAWNALVLRDGDTIYS